MNISISKSLEDDKIPDKCTQNVERANRSLHWTLMEGSGSPTPNWFPDTKLIYYKNNECQKKQERERET